MGKTYIKEENGEKVLYEEGSLVDTRLGKLYENWDGSLETRNAFGENYDLEKESHLFGTPDYKIESSKGKSGTLEYESPPLIPFVCNRGSRYEGELETSSGSGSSTYSSSGSGGGGGGGGGSSSSGGGGGSSSSGGGGGSGYLGCLGVLLIGGAIIGATFYHANIQRNGNEVKKEQYIESPKYSEREKTQLQKEEYTQESSKLEEIASKTVDSSVDVKQNLENRTSESRTNSQTARQEISLVVREEQPAQIQQVSRFSYLESKYGSSMAAKLNSGKIWKRMNTEMVKDSWGAPKKIKRGISRNIIKEEWIFKNTWLYFENNTLVEWGPTRK